MQSVWAPSRLHFGLLSLAGDGEAWPDRRGERVLPARRFGGVGLMIERPGVRVTASPAVVWSADGPLAERRLSFALRFAESVRRDRPEEEPAPRRLTVEEAPPEHVGLGVGTQLGLAVARALAAAWGLVLDAPALARRVGRGLRSALGVHGFAHGGFLVESGKRGDDDGLAPLAARAPFPPQWRLVLATPSAALGLHGREERQAFARLVSGRLHDPARLGRTDCAMPAGAAGDAARARRGGFGGVRGKPPRLQRPGRRGVRRAARGRLRRPADGRMRRVPPRGGGARRGTEFVGADGVRRRGGRGPGRGPAAAAGGAVRSGAGGSLDDGGLQPWVGRGAGRRGAARRPTPRREFTIRGGDCRRAAAAAPAAGTAAPSALRRAGWPSWSSSAAPDCSQSPTPTPAVPPSPARSRIAYASPPSPTGSEIKKRPPAWESGGREDRERRPGQFSCV